MSLVTSPDTLAVLEQLGMIGVSWRQGGAQSIADFSLDESDIEDRLREFAETQDLTELGYLATCNRVELIYTRRQATNGVDLRPQAFELLRGRAPMDGEAERRLKAWSGEGAAEHLFLIAAGLDSACVGETEISGQVRRCHERARDMALSGHALDIVFGEAQRIGARVRGETRLGHGRVSLAEIAAQRLIEHADERSEPIALIGVSPMTERAAQSLADAGVSMLFVNRSPARAEELANQFHASHSSLASFIENPPAISAVLSATGAPGAVLEHNALERIRNAAGELELLMVDMAIPPDIDPQACESLGIERLDMDAINAIAEANRAARLVESAQAREHVDDALNKLNDRFAERYYGPLLGALQQRYQRTAREGVQRLLKKELKGLGEEERTAIQTWCDVLARRFAHIPCLGIRGLVHSGPEGSVEAFLSGLETEFADELRAALDSRSSTNNSRSSTNNE
jgi:glutamyl-tRNA reductase